MASNIILAKQPCPFPNCGSSDAFYQYADGHGYCYSCKGFLPSTNKDLDSLQYTYEYLPWRGVTKETMAFYDIKTKIAPNGQPLSAGFRYPNGSYLVRFLDKKDFYIEKNEDGKAPEGLFGRDKFDPGSHKYVTITEGALDAVSLQQVLKQPVVSVQSSSSARRDCAVDFGWLSSFEKVYLAFDGDAAGRDAERAVARLFDSNKVHSVKFTRRKDANEYLRHGEGDELRNIWWNSKRYLPENIKTHLQEFRDILQAPTRKGIPYPFPTLNDMTYGIRTGESVLITAQEGVGKTELMHAIEYQLLKETDDGVGAIFLEEPKQRHLQALAGLELKRPVHLPDTGCTTDQIIAGLEKIVRRDSRLCLYSHFGSEDPSVLVDTIRFLVSACAVRYVLFDHISMAVSGLSGEDERRALDVISTRLEMMVKELDFALIIVSHVNDEGLTRGSRYISKIADIRIDAKRDLQAADPVIRNTTQLTISKNRFSGRTGPAGVLLFDPTTFTYREELQHANDNSPSPSQLVFTNAS